MELISLNLPSKTFFCAIFLYLQNVSLGALTTAQKSAFEANSVTIAQSGSTYTFSHTGIPAHSHGSFPNPSNPNSISTQSHQFKIPVTPTARSSPGCLNGGPIGMAVSGIPLFNPYTAEGNDAVTGDCAETFDDCQGHPDPMGTYHYHQIPTCVYQNGNDEILGIALDGYLIYGPRDNTGSAPTDLDDCGGKTGSDGVYRYYAQEKFPYIIKCYHGELSPEQTVPGCSKPQTCTKSSAESLRGYTVLIVSVYLCISAIKVVIFE